MNDMFFVPFTSQEISNILNIEIPEETSTETELPPSKRQKTSSEDQLSPKTTRKRSVGDLVDRVWSCNFEGCEKRFKRQDHLRRHQQIHSGERQFKCNLCEKAFFEKEHLKRHINQVHQRQFPCDFQGCTLTFARESLLLSHKAKIHLNKLPYSCTIPGCEAAFDYESRLKDHLNRHRKEKRKFVCGVVGCAKDFLKKRELDEHIEKDHPDIAPREKCTICGEILKPPNLKRHMETHLPQKEVFVCNLNGCGKTFSSPWNVKFHQARVHEGTAKKYDCPHEGCGKSFWNKQQLQKHELTFHSENPPKSRKRKSIYEKAFGFTVNWVTQQVEPL